MRVAIALLTCVALSCGLGCRGLHGRSTPQSALSQFSEDLQGARWSAAYKAMSEAYRDRTTLAEFREQMEAHPGEVRELARLLKAEPSDAEVTASLPLEDGSQFDLIHDGSRWRIQGNIVDFYSQSTPRAALRSFIRAMERRRYDVVMRFVPEADREGMSEERMREAWDSGSREEIDRLLVNLRSHIDNPIEEVGDRATMPYGDRFTVLFVREDGVWRIEDPD